MTPSSPGGRGRLREARIVGPGPLGEDELVVELGVVGHEEKPDAGIGQVALDLVDELLPGTPCPAVRRDG